MPAERSTDPKDRQKQKVPKTPEGGTHKSLGIHNSQQQVENERIERLTYSIVTASRMFFRDMFVYEINLDCNG